MNGRFIVELPTSLSTNIISEWLGLPDRVRLDSAHCQVSVREEFLQLIRSPELSVKSWQFVQELLNNRAFITWALTREVFVEKLLVQRECDLKLYSSYLQRFASRVFVLRLNCCKIGRLSQRIVHCRNLLVLKLRSWKLLATLRDVFVNCTRLREFQYLSPPRHSPDPDPSDPPLTSAHLEKVTCTSLKYLELDRCDADLVTAFLRMAVAVEIVALAPEEEYLKRMYKRMSPTANTLSLRRISVKENVVKFATRCQRIANLLFQHCSLADTVISSLCSFSNLSALDLSYAEFESENYLNVLASSCGDRLTELLLFTCQPTLPLVTVQEVLPLFTRLESLSLLLENDNDTTIWNVSSFSRLTKLSMCYYGDSDVELVSQLTEHCYVNLRELNLAVVLSEQVNDELADFVSGCTNLCVLRLKDYCEDLDEDKYWYTGEDEERWQSLRPGLAVSLVEEECEHHLRVFDKFDDSGLW